MRSELGPRCPRAGDDAAERPAAVLRLGGRHRFTKTGTVDFDDIADDLYGPAPERFTASRDARAGEARAAGDRSLAERIKKLRRPTVPAWLGNRLARDRAHDIEDLIGLGAQLREAQAGLSGDELRRLSRRRGDVVAGLVAQAKGLALAEGRSVSDAVFDEVTATLEAALADPAGAEALRRGRLTVALHYSGSGLVVDPSPPAVSGRRTRTEARGRGGPAPAGRRRTAQRAAERATEEVARTAASLEEAEDEHRATGRRVEEAEAAVHASARRGSRGGATGDQGPQGAPIRGGDAAPAGAGGRAAGVSGRVGSGAHDEIRWLGGLSPAWTASRLSPAEAL